MNEINGKQLSIIIFFIPLVFKMSMLPSFMYAAAGSDGYVAVAIITAIEFLQLWLILFICSKGGIAAIKNIYGRRVASAISVPLLAVIFVKSIIFIGETVNYVTEFLFYNIEGLPIIISVLTLCFYLAYKGAGTIAKLFQLAVWFIPLIVVMGAIFGEVNLNGEYLLEVTGNGATIWNAITKYLIYTFDFSPLLFCNIKIKSKISVGVCSVLSILAVTGGFMLLYARYGKASFMANCAFARLASFDTVISEIGSLDWVSGLLWLSVASLNLGLKFFAVGEIFSGMKIKKTIGLGTFCIALFFCLTRVWDNMDKAIQMVTSGVQYGVFLAEVTVPVLLFFFIILAQKRGLCVEAQNGCSR